MKDSQDTGKIEDVQAADTPEDVAVLYSWANLHGAKYRDFSASRREYRAQLRHRAAEQSSQDQAAVPGAEDANAAQPARSHAPGAPEASFRQASRESDTSAQNAAAERVEAARRAEAAAIAEAAARREEREIAEAHAAAQRQADHYADSELRHRTATTALPSQQAPLREASLREARGPLSDLHAAQSYQPVPSLEEVRPNRYRRSTDRALVPAEPEYRSSVSPQGTQRRPQGYRPDDASGVRQIYRGPETDAALDSNIHEERERRASPVSQQETVPLPDSMYSQRPPSVSYKLPSANPGERRADQQFLTERRASRQEIMPSLSASSDSPIEHASDPGFAARRDDLASQASGSLSGAREPMDGGTVAYPAARPAARPATPPRPGAFTQSLTPSEFIRGRRAEDDFDYKQVPGASESARPAASDPLPETAHTIPQRPPYVADQAGPAWLYAPPSPQAPPRPKVSAPPPVQSSVADTLQQSRERVASRWFALKGVFEQPGQELPEAAPVRQKETRTPVLAVFSLAGGVGKTSLVATVGRALSSLGEKVLLTDTTSHGLLPFYFGASELRQNTVRTFSPPSGSTDAPIYLVSHDVEEKASDEAAQEQLVEDIINNSRGTHRILLDLASNSSWIVRRMARMNPTVLVPVAPDMNSVISLQTVERYFHGVTDGDGRPVQPFYVLNQFDTALPLHLDVREVLRRQLGDRLLPFVIRRAPSVSEALAEGMTVVDYAPDAPVAEDYVNLATWLRTISAPAAAGFRNVRWSER